MKKLEIELKEFGSTLTEKQLVERKHSIGASDVSVILGLSKYKSALELYFEKKTGESNFSGNEKTHWGSIMENMIVADYSKRIGLPIDTDRPTYQHLEIAGFHANLDGIYNHTELGEVLTECKTVSPFVWANAWDHGAKIPNDYMTQVQAQMAVTCAKYCDLIAWVDRELHAFRIEADIQDINLIEKRVSEFIELLKGDIPPEATALDNEYFKNKYPDSITGEPVEIKGLKAIEYSETEDQFNLWKSKLEGMKAKLKEQMGNAEKANFDGLYSISWKTTKPRETFDAKRFKLEDPATATKYIKVGDPSRPFKVKEV